MDSTRPSFQQPHDPESNLIANGWIEQYRRSKMRTVWKEVLASLVEGQHPGEETTLWIQRETINPTTLQSELEPLHQVPIKALQSVTLREDTTDNQFHLRIYNSEDDLVFRCLENPVDSLRWVQILKKYQTVSKGGTHHHMEEKKETWQAPDLLDQPIEQPHQQLASSASVGSGTSSMNIRELRAICHGAGINTAGMERVQLERAAQDVMNRGTYFAPNGAAPSYYTPFAHAPAPSSAQSYHSWGSHTSAPRPAVAPAKPKLSVHELRAICHGAGINTAGMERSQLEAAAEEVQRRGTYFTPPPPGTHAPADDHTRQHEVRARQEEARRKEEEERRRRAMAEEEARREAVELERRRQTAEAERKRKAEEEARRRQHEMELRRRAEEEARRKAAELEQRRRAEEEQRRKAEEEARRKAAELEHRRRAEEEARRRRVEEEARRKAAELEQRRKAEEEARRRAAEEARRKAAEQQRQQHEAQLRYQQQQAAWKKQQEEAERQRQQAERDAAEEKRRQQEAMGRQQQWGGGIPSSNPHHQQQPWNHHQQRPPPRAGHFSGWQQPPPQQPFHPQQPPRAGAPPPQQPHRNNNPTSPASQKWAGMANENQGNSQATITRIKHDLLIQWALQPPQLQMLRPIDALITSIHKVFPPALGVSGHAYFQKWKPVVSPDITGASGLPDDKKLEKSVKKLRFFLHPDKLPRDLNEDQKFLTKMLWDVTSDAWEEHQKRKEEIGWAKR